MKNLYPSLLCLFISIVNLQAAEQEHPVAKRKRQPTYSHYIGSASYRDSLKKESEENLEILEKLHEAVEKGPLSELDELLRKNPSECGRFLGKYQQRPTRPPIVHSAIVRAAPDIIRTILPYIPDLNLLDETPFGNNNTPLHCAAQLKKPTRQRICQILLSQGADLNIKNRLGKTPLHLTCESFDDPFLVKLFIYNGANIQAQTYQGLTPLHIAVAKGHFEIVKTLLLCGAKYRCVDYDKRTPLHIARENRRKDPNNIIYHNILAHLEALDMFDSFLNELLNFEEPAALNNLSNSQEPANKRARIE